MERKKASDFDPQLLSLFDRYVHGAINRREFLEGAAKFAIGGLTATALWDMLKPNYALAQQVPKDDKRIKAEYTMYPSPKGNSSNGRCADLLVRPATGDKFPVVVVVHENRGLNPYIEDVVRRLPSPASWHLDRTRFGLLAAIQAWTSTAPRPMRKRRRCRESLDEGKSAKTSSPGRSFCSSTHSPPASLAPWVSASAVVVVNS